LYLCCGPIAHKTFFFKEEKGSEVIVSSPVLPNAINNINRQPSINNINGINAEEFENRSISIESPTIYSANTGMSNTTHPITGNEVNNEPTTNNREQGIQYTIKQLGNILITTLLMRFS